MTRSAAAQPEPTPAQPELPLAQPELPPGVPPPPVSSTKPTPTIAAPRPEPPEHAVQVSYDKAVAIATRDGQFAVKLSFRSQLRFESVRPTESNSQFVSHFSIPRSRLQVEGRAFGNDNRYKLEFGLGDAGSFSFVKDLYVDKRLASGPVWLRAGQWKRPFNRQEMVSDFASEFNERANTATFVGGGRDLGVAIHNDLEKSPAGVEWMAGVFNTFNGGADRPAVATTCTQNTMTGAITCTTPAPTNFPSDFGPSVVVRAGWNTGEIKGYSEGDLDGGPLRLAVAASYKIDLANFAKRKEASVSDNLSHGLEADAMLKAHGLAVEVGLYVMKQKSADAQYGVLVQPGYFVVPKHGEIAARFAYAPVGARKQIEARAAFNWYWQGHAWKWATDAGFVKLTKEDPVTRATDSPDVQVRSMLQLTL